MTAHPAPAWLDELDLRTDGPPWVAMGLRRVDEDGWLVADEERRRELGERWRLLDVLWDDVVHLAPGTEAAGAEVLALVRGWLDRHPELEEIDAPAAGGGEHPLVTAARLVQEDLCLMVPRRVRGGLVRHHLDAAVVCFPSAWVLAEKAGAPAAAIHAPVPTYAEDLADKVDRYLARLRPGVIGIRRNWSIHDTPALHAARPIPPRRLHAGNVATLWLRSERQTLRALPGSGAVLFTIRVQQCGFGVLPRRPDIARALAARLRAQPAELVAMNGLAGRVDVVTAWLDGISGSPSPLAPA